MSTNTGERVGPRKYRKKPVVIDAVRIAGHGGNAGAMDWINRHDDGGAFLKESSMFLPGYCFHIRTLEGDMRANRGDWIIRGVNGEFYPCKSDIFAKTYEASEMSIWQFNKPRVNIIVTRSKKTGKYFNLIVDSRTGKNKAVSSVRHTEDSKAEAIAEAHQISRVHRIVIED